jgi:hypothetical protein
LGDKLSPFVGTDEVVLNRRKDNRKLVDFFHALKRFNFLLLLELAKVRRIESDNLWFCEPVPSINVGTINYASKPIQTFCHCKLTVGH